ncbi:GPP34 family phosphoprotein [Microbispora hainanensis]|uniref:GOLPH3/VPS74 family protein n=1 Tax=Microbispora TaxID=2005 RepID=UPI0011575AA1|nr:MULTISPECIES: GPP34 family phosphoprotein [Microbispora]NJP25564.1 GPP34 family phosphoprotein [Microbispora sp. CL1-1]TQS13516.1 GPP34 family phosphoprotein [Microbispora sp. SCL1-1]
MDVPRSLTAQLYLLAYDPRKERVVTNFRFPYLLRAAALTDLLLTGRIADDGGKVRVVSEERLADPVLDGLLHQIAQSGPRPWRHWIGKDTRATARAVRDELETKRWIRVELRQPFLVFNRSHVRVRDTRVVKRLATRVSAALTGPVSRVGDHEAALVGLAAAAELGTILPRARRRAYKQRIALLSERGGPATPALRKVIQQAHAMSGG